MKKFIMILSALCIGMSAMAQGWEEEVEIKADELLGTPDCVVSIYTSADMRSIYAHYSSIDMIRVASVGKDFNVDYDVNGGWYITAIIGFYENDTLIRKQNVELGTDIDADMGEMRGRTAREVREWLESGKDIRIVADYANGERFDLRVKGK